MQLLVWDWVGFPHDAFVGTHPVTKEFVTAVVKAPPDHWAVRWQLHRTGWEGPPWQHSSLEDAKKAAQEVFNNQQAVDMQDILLAAKPL
jgi:hypothetical protein